MNPLEHPGFLPFKLDLDQQRMLWVRMDADARAQAAFLDERALPASAEGYWIPLAPWLALPPASPARVDWIFHIGHCGSTLLSRLLQAWPEVEALREPLPLRALAAAPASPARATVLSRLLPDLGRPLPPCTRVVAKATSSCTALAGEVLAHDPRSRACLLEMPLEPWLATLLKSPGSVADALAAAPARARLLAAGDAALAGMLDALPPPRRCAMSWLAERVRHAPLAGGAGGGRYLRIDFERLLAAPGDTLSMLAVHFDLAPSGVDAALASPWWRRYAKAGAHAYDPRDRAADLALSRQRNGDAIADALRWLEGFVAAHPGLAAHA